MLLASPVAPGHPCQGCPTKRCPVHKGHALLEAAAPGETTKKRVVSKRVKEAYGWPLLSSHTRLHLQEAAERAAAAGLVERLEKLYSSLPPHLLKALSHLGGAPPRPGLPGWKCTPLVREPGNAAYGRALRALLAAAGARASPLSALGDEAMGDVLEAFFALSAGGPDARLTPHGDEAAIQALLLVAAAE
jgi:hypothetical protein